MYEENGTPTGGCTVAAGTTEWIILTGIGVDMASSGDMYTLSVYGTNGGSASTGGNFG